MAQMIPIALTKLAAEWREEAQQLRTRYRDERLATLCETHAQELEQAAAAAQVEELTLDEAAMICGYSVSHLRNFVARGLLTNVGRPGAVRVRRGDLPVKGGRMTQALTPWKPASPGRARLQSGRNRNLTPAEAARRQT